MTVIKVSSDGSIRYCDSNGFAWRAKLRPSIIHVDGSEMRLTKKGRYRVKLEGKWVDLAVARMKERTEQIVAMLLDASNPDK